MVGAYILGDARGRDVMQTCAAVPNGRDEPDTYVGICVEAPRYN